MPAPRKYPDEMRERAIRLVLDIAQEAGSITRPTHPDMPVSGCRVFGVGPVILRPRDPLLM